MEHIKTEEQVISILLNNKDSAKAWIDSPFDLNYFDDAHSNILSGIKYATIKDSSLTRSGFKEFLTEYKKLTPAEIAAQTATFNRCLMNATKKDDLPILLDKVKTAHIRRRSAQYIRDYSKDRERLGDIGANRSLIDRLSGLENSVSDVHADYAEINTVRSGYMQSLLHRRANPESRITTDIIELDYTMVKGLAPGHMTLFCAAPGGYKTTMMVNMAVNLFKKGVSVLYVPVEMSKDEIIHKFVSRETQIELAHLDQAEKLTEDEVKRVDEELLKWEGFTPRFGLLKMKERSKVSDIRREIQKRMSFFQPKVVFIDYVDNLMPEHRRSRSDEEMNQILEDLRAMGAALGFSIVSAAQLARDALKRLKEQKDGKQGAAFDSSDIRGGQVYTANSDNVFGQLKDPDDPRKLILTCIKSRHGPTTFRNGASRAVLAVKPNIALIESEPETNVDFRAKEGQEFVGMIATPPPPIEDEGSPF